MLNVMVGEEWPSSSLTTLVGTPDASMSDAAVCRVSCSRIRGSLAAFTAVSNQSEILSGWYGTPSSSGQATDLKRPPGLATQGGRSLAPKCPHHGAPQAVFCTWAKSPVVL